MKDLKTTIISSFVIIAIAFPQWSTDPGSPQSLGSGIQAQLAPTLDGGCYLAWLGDGNNYPIYLQRLNSVGEPQWNDGGIVVSNNVNASWIAVYHLNLAVDSEGNAIITTVDQRSGGDWEVYAYKIAPDSSMLWGDDGLALTASSVSNMSPRLAVLPDNSVVVTWVHDNNTVLFQRISSSGALLWGTGIPIEDDDATLLSPQPVVTVGDDVLIQWIRQSGPFWAANSELYLQKYDLDGSPMWTNPIVAGGPVVFPMGNWLQQSIADAEGGSFSAWTEMSGSVQNARVQHINGDGMLSWTGGVDLSTNSSNFHISPRITIAGETQEIMAIWKEKNESQSQIGIYAQRLDSGGNRLWSATGIPVVGLNSSYDYLDLSIAGIENDMIAVYIQQSVNINGDIYAARLDANGNSVWMDGSVPVTNSNSPKSDMMTAKGPGCLFIAWTENGSVYAHCLLGDGTFGPPRNTLLVPSEYQTIQDAIDSASDGDMVLVASGTYIENINYNGKNIAVIGENRETTIIDGNQIGSVVKFENGEDSTAVLKGFMIQNGNSNDGGGIHLDSSSPTLTNLTIRNNIARDGGGMYILSSSPILTDMMISNNTATGSSGNDGGGIYTQHSNLTLTNVTISNNTASDDGGGIYIVDLNPTLTNVTIINNTASDNGGGMFLMVANPTLTNVTISNNTASDDGGGIYCGNSCSPSLVNCVLWNDSPEEIVSTATVIYSDIQGGWEGEGNIDIDPIFCNSDSSDFTLEANSPCVGTGENGANMGALGVGCGPPENFSVIYPTVSDTFSTHVDSDTAITFTWEESFSFDMISDVMYTLTIELEFFGNTYTDIHENINDTTISISSNSLDPLLVVTSQDDAVFTYFVHASDEEYTVSSDTGQFVLSRSPLGCYENEVELWGKCYSIAETDSLDLPDSSLTGEIPPEIGHLTNLTFLELSQNQLTGEIPTEIGNLINLKWLSLWENQLTGNIPESIWDLILLENLDLGANQLAGSIPPEIGNLINLQKLFLDNSQFTGEIPPEIGNLVNLVWLVLSGNELTGEIPSEIWNLTNLRALYLSNNQFTGSIHSEIGNLEHLQRIVVYSNQFTGNIPSEIGNLTNLVRLKMHSNQLTGPIPETLCNLSNLTWSLEDSSYSVSTLYGNQLCSPYPSCVEDFVGEQDTANCEQVSIIDETLPMTYNLHNAYPNPFNPFTTLHYDLPENANVNIIIYDMVGRQISTLVNSQQTAGYKSVRWNATNDKGSPVSAGLYLYTIQADEFRQTKKMVLLK